MRTVSLEQALRQLQDFCQRINCDGMKQHHKRRVEETLRLLKLPVPISSATREDLYQRFLSHAQTVCGLEGTALCAAGLGKTAIIEMKITYRWQLPSRLKEAKLECPALRSFLASSNERQSNAMLRGDSS